jgi:hypothetical protein
MEKREEEEGLSQSLCTDQFEHKFVLIEVQSPSSVRF